MPEQRRIRYELALVGGPFDGTPDLAWADWGGDPPPETIFVGTCPGDGRCMADERLCKDSGHGRAHTAYWLDDEGERPVGCFEYGKSRDFVRRVQPGNHFIGEAEYVVPGLALPKPEESAKVGKVIGVEGDKVKVALGV